MLDGYIPLKFLVSRVSPKNQGESLFEDPIREKNWDVKKEKKKNPKETEADLCLCCVPLGERRCIIGALY